MVVVVVVVVVVVEVDVIGAVVVVVVTDVGSVVVVVVSGAGSVVVVVLLSLDKTGILEELLVVVLSLPSLPAQEAMDRSKAAAITAAVIFNFIFYSPFLFFSFSMFPGIL